LGELIDVIIEEKAGLFVCAIGVPPKPVVDKLHAAGIPVMNVSPRALAIGCTNAQFLRWSVTLSMLPRHLLSAVILSALRVAREEAYVLRILWNCFH
jgi:ABC-type phosphate transport system permease subunit